MTQQKSAPTYANFAFDVPEPQSLSGEFVYNYFMKDEKVTSNPWSDLSVVKRHTPRSDYNEESDVPGVPSRKNVINFSSLKDISEIADVEAANLMFTEKERLDFLKNNAGSILSETNVQTDRSIFVSIQDEATAKEMQDALEATLVHQKAFERGLSPLEAVLKFNSITSDKINAKDILDVTDIEANTNITYYDPVTGKDLSVQTLERISKKAVGGSYNSKFVHDILKHAQNIPFSPLYGKIGKILSDSADLQSKEEKEIDSNKIFMSDYEMPIEPIQIINMPPGAIDNLVEPCGYVIEKYEVDDNENSNFVKYFFVASLEKSSIEDYEVVYGKTYKYRIKSVFFLSSEAADFKTSPGLSQPGLSYATYLFSSRGSPEIKIVCKEVVPPPPPINIQFFLSQEKKMLIFWDMPFNKQEDIKRFQIFKRSNLQEPYSLLAQLDFDDSEILNRRSENVPLWKNIKKDFATTNYLDSSYDIGQTCYYAICSIDAHDLSSPYSNQFKVSYDGVQGKMKTELIAYSGSPKPYPNFTIKETLLEDCMKDSGHKKMKIYFDPECLILNGPIESQDFKVSAGSNLKRSQEKEFLETSSDLVGPAIPMYKMQIINLDRQQDQKIDIYVKRSKDLISKINNILPGD